MTEPAQDDDQVTRGAAEEMSDAPLTPTEKEASERPPSHSPNDEEQVSGEDS